jgi:SAM-dependent methyltransferase
VICIQPVAPAARFLDRDVKWVKCDLLRPPLPWPERHFDLAVMGEVMEHLPVYPVPPLTEVRRVLKPGGHLLVTTPNVASLHKRVRLAVGQSPMHHLYPEESRFDSHYREYTMCECRSLLQRAGYEIRWARYSWDFDSFGARMSDVKRFYRRRLVRVAMAVQIPLYSALTRLYSPFRANIQIMAARPQEAADALPHGQGA